MKVQNVFHIICSFSNACICIFFSSHSFFQREGKEGSRLPHAFLQSAACVCVHLSPGTSQLQNFGSASPLRRPLCCHYPNRHAFSFFFFNHLHHTSVCLQSDLNFQLFKCGSGSSPVGTHRVNSAYRTSSGEIMFRYQIAWSKAFTSIIGNGGFPPKISPNPTMQITTS